MKCGFYKLFSIFVLFSSLVFSSELTLGEEAPSFQVGTQQGNRSFPGDFLGEWILLFSVPNLMTTVCTLELAKCLQMTQVWNDLRTRCCLLTCHEGSEQQKWLQTALQNMGPEGAKISQEDLPLLLSDPEKKIANLYGMIHPHVTSEKPIRSVFVIDPCGKIRFVAFYPMKNGRNFEEIARIIAAMQKTDEKSSYVTSPDWKMGESPMVCAPCAGLKK